MFSIKNDYSINLKRSYLFDVYILGLTPLVTFFTPNDSFSMFTLLPLTIVLLFRFIIYANISSVSANRVFKISLVIILWLSFSLLINFISNPSIITTISFVRLFYIAECLLFFFLVTVKKYCKSEMFSLFKVALFSGFVISSAIIYTWITEKVAGKISLYSVYGNYVEENYTAALLALIFMVGLFRYFLYQKTALQFLQLVTVAFAVMLTGSRASVGAILLSIIVFALFYKTNTSLTRRLLSIVMILSIILTFAYLSYLFLPVWTWNRLFVNSYDDYSNTTRLQIWTAAFKGFLEHPVHGWGIGNFSMMLTNRNQSIVAHNSYLSLLVDGGLVYFSLMIYLVYPYIKKIILFRKPYIALLSCFFIVTFMVEANRMVFFWYGLFLIVTIAESTDNLNHNKLSQASERVI
jgi:O-antigen ligase